MPHGTFHSSYQESCILPFPSRPSQQHDVFCIPALSPLYSLEEYLQELTGGASSSASQSIMLSQDDGVPSSLSQASQRLPSHGSDVLPNFAHAALLLQNSSHIYSRKVEYLYGLVYKALEEFFRDHALSPSSSSSSSCNNQHKKRSMADASLDEFYNYDPHIEFLLLDDILPEDDDTQAKINLKPSKQHYLDGFPRTMGSATPPPGSTTTPSGATGSLWTYVRIVQSTIEDSHPSTPN